MKSTTKKNKIYYFIAVLFLFAGFLIPPLFAPGNRNETNSQKNPVCLWKEPSLKNCPSSNWVVKKDVQGCPYLYCLKPREVLGEKTKTDLVRLTAEKEIFQPGETIIITVRNISGRRINLPNEIFWEIKRITDRGEQSIFPQTSPMASLTTFDRNNIFKISWDQKDKRGKTPPPGDYQFIIQIEDQLFTLNFNITNLK